MNASHRSAAPRLAAALLLSTCCACADAMGPAGSLRIVADATEVIEGATLQLSATSDGADVAAGRLTWESRDRTTLTVRDGLVYGVAPGSAWVVARAGEARDSVRIRVRFADAGAGLAVRVAGEGEAGEVAYLGGTAVMLGLEGGSHLTTHIRAANVASGVRYTDAEWADTLVILSFAGPPEVGKRTIPAPEVVTSPRFDVRQREGAELWLRLRETDRRFKAYVPVRDAEVEVLGARLPPSPGLASGNVVGTLAFEAAGFMVDIADDGSQTVTPIGDQTVQVYAEFAVPIHHLVHALSDVTVSGGLFPGTYPVSGQATWIDGGEAVAPGVTASHSGLTVDLGTVGSSRTEHLMLGGRLWIPEPKVGSWQLSVAPQRPDSVGGPWAFARMEAWPADPGGNGYVTTPDAESCFGSLTVTEYTPATRTRYGWLRVTLGCSVFWRSTPPGTPVANVGGALVIPIQPLDGLPL